jgi:hypothetical protein
MKRNPDFYSDEPMKIVWIWILASLTLLAVQTADVLAKGRQIAFVVSSESVLSPKLTLDDVKKTYTGRMDSHEGQKIALTELRQKPLFTVFLKEVLEIGESSYQTLWLKKVFSEGAIAPRQAKTSAELIRFISENRNALGFLWMDEIKSAEGQTAQGVKILFAFDVREGRETEK